MALPLDQSVVCPVLVGRAPLVLVLERLLEQVRTGQGAIAILAGEAGIGKSRLVAQIKENARRRSFSTLEGQCFEPDRALPYAPLLDLLRTLPAGRLARDLARDFAPVAENLAGLLADGDAFLPSPVDAEPGSTPVLTAAQETRRLFEALARLFARLAATGPLLVIVEDLHWCDDTSLDFLLYLARRVAEHPLC